MLSRNISSVIQVGSCFSIPARHFSSSRNASKPFITPAIVYLKSICKSTPLRKVLQQRIKYREKNNILLPKGIIAGKGELCEYGRAEKEQRLQEYEEKHEVKLDTKFKNFMISDNSLVYSLDASGNLGIPALLEFKYGDELEYPMINLGHMKYEYQWDRAKNSPYAFRVEDKHREKLFYIAKNCRNKFKQGQLWAGFLEGKGEEKKVTKARLIAKNWEQMEKQFLSEQERFELLSLALEQRSTRRKASKTKPKLPTYFPTARKIVAPTYNDPDLGVVWREGDEWCGEMKLPIMGKDTKVSIFIEGDLLTQFTQYQINSVKRLKAKFDKIEQEIIKTLAKFYWEEWDEEKLWERGSKKAPTDEQLYNHFVLEFINVPVHNWRDDLTIVSLWYTAKKKNWRDAMPEPKIVLMGERIISCFHDRLD